MADKINAHCIICGNGYHMCLSCKDYAKTHPWQIYTDTADHYMIHTILHGYYVGVYSKSEAKEKLQNVDLTGMENFVPEVKKLLDEVLEDDNTEVLEMNTDNVLDLDNVILEDTDKVELNDTHNEHTNNSNLFSKNKKRRSKKVECE